MDSLLKYLLLIAFASSAASAATGSLSEARTYSFLIRDRGLDPAEVQAIEKGDKTAADYLDSWLDSEDHQQRMSRYFDDMMGFRDGLNILQPNAQLAKSTDGVYFVRQKSTCTKEEAVTAHGWWMPEGTTALFCPDLVQTALTVMDGKKTIICSKPGRNGFLHPQCGCGPELVSCIAPEEGKLLLQEAKAEFSRQALIVYNRGQGWLDLLAGDRFYGTRRLYWLYFTGQAMSNPQAYTAAALHKLMGLPLDEPTVTDYPEGAERSGIATAPGFLVQFNNFRSRIAGLTRSFLCQDVDPSLNTDGIARFVNPSLTPADTAHGSKDGCSSCHFALDNLGGALLNWTDRGALKADTATDAYAFGAQGKGPAFLMHAYVERAPGFNDCMAKRAWEDLTGQPWTQVSDAEKTVLRNWVNDGPRSFLQKFIKSTELRTALSQDGSDGPKTDLDPADWARIQPIVQANCSGGSCHSTGSRMPPYVDQSKLWISDAKKLSDRLQRSGSGQMPPLSSGKVLNPPDRAVLLGVLGSISP